MRVIVCVLVLLASLNARGQEFGPWKFGMSEQDIRSLDEFAPYKSFANGDVETYKGVFAGRERNFQFYLRDGRLRRIAVRMYEGNDIEHAAEAWLETYKALSGIFGAVDIPYLESGTPEEIAHRARIRVEGGSKAQMAPRAQHAAQFVFCTFMAGDSPFGGKLFMVTVNIDEPRRH